MHLDCFFDGSYGQHKRIAAWGYLVKNEEGVVIRAASGRVPKGRPASSVVGEYEALIQAMLFISRNYPDADVTFHGDSALVIAQMNGEAQARKGVYLPLHQRAVEIVERHKQPRGRPEQPIAPTGPPDALEGQSRKQGVWHFQWISRALNSEADKLSAYRF
jgi:ribonuclease HI